MASCTLVAQLDEVDEIPACDSGSDDRPRDLVVQLSKMGVHLGDLVELRVVNENGFVVTRAIYDGLPSEEVTVVMRGGVLEGPHRLDMWADLSGNRSYEAPPVDHAWSLDSCKSGAWTFVHSGNFADIEEVPPKSLGGDFVIHLEDMGVHLGQLLELWVIHGENDRMVGYYHVTEISAESFTLTIPGIIEQGVPYRAVFYADQSHNGQYDPPDTDHAWRVQGTGDASGWVVDFQHNPEFTDIGEDLER